MAFFVAFHTQVWYTTQKGGDDMQRLKEKKLFLLDMDGTLYLGNRLFDCTLPFLKKAKELNLKLY